MAEYAQRDVTPCYWLGKIQYVPHYVKPQVFVAPGGIEKTEKYLLDLGAAKATDYLWSRHWIVS